jgi:hypothetical protein
MHSPNVLPDVEGSVPTWGSRHGEVIRASWLPLSVPAGSSGGKGTLEPPVQEPGAGQIGSGGPPPAPPKGFRKPFVPAQEPRITVILQESPQGRSQGRRGPGPGGEASGGELRVHLRGARRAT